MKINETDIKEMLAKLPEIELPEDFHDEVMSKIKLGGKRKRPIVRYIGPLAVAAALVVIMVAVLDFGPAYEDFSVDLAPFAVAAEADIGGEAPMVRAVTPFDADAAFEGISVSSFLEIAVLPDNMPAALEMIAELGGHGYELFLFPADFADFDEVVASLLALGVAEDYYLEGAELVVITLRESSDD